MAVDDRCYCFNEVDGLVSQEDAPHLCFSATFISGEPVKPAVWLDAGLGGNNNRCYINITQLVEHMEPVVVDTLPGLHSFTGSDYTESYMNKGKLKPFDLVFKEAFAQPGKQNMVCEHVVSAFVCSVYG